MTTIPSALIIGISGCELNDYEIAFIKQHQPLGVILFRRNIATKVQTKALTDHIYALLEHDIPLILIDQEGGRVARLTAPEWPEFPAAATFGALHQLDAQAAHRALVLNYQLQASYLAEIGVNVDCAPVLDVRVDGAHRIVGDRAFSSDPHDVAELAEIAANALISQGVLPVIKHVPGHGRALVDSHAALPTITTPLEELDALDFIPFTKLSSQPFAMTAHITYTALDSAHCATLSSTVLAYIRNQLGVQSVIMTDDLSMHALGGTFEERGQQTLAAGCDILLHCNGNPAEMDALANVAPALDSASVSRIQAARDDVPHARYLDRVAAHAELDALLARL